MLTLFGHGTPALSSVTKSAAEFRMEGHSLEVGPSKVILQMAPAREKMTKFSAR